MTNFTLNNGNTYTEQDNGYCFVTINGKKTRCKHSSLRIAYEQYVREENARQNAANEFTNIDPIVEKVDESETTEETKKIAKELAPKAKKVRKSKDIAYEFSNGGVEFTLTAKQVDFIRHLPDTHFWEEGLDSTIWVDCLCDDIQGQFAGKPMTIGAMISTLCEKGLGERATERRDGRKCTSFALTDWGKAIAKDLGLE